MPDSHVDALTSARVAVRRVSHFARTDARQFFHADRDGSLTARPVQGNIRAFHEGVNRKEAAMRWNGNRSGDWAELAREGVGPLTVALREAQLRGEVTAACEPEVVAHFVVASLKGALVVSKLTKDATVMRQCMHELERYLELYEVPESC
jgi:hypothetical protein